MMNKPLSGALFLSLSRAHPVDSVDRLSLHLLPPIQSVFRCCIMHRGAEWGMGHTAKDWAWRMGGGTVASLTSQPLSALAQGGEDDE